MMSYLQIYLQPHKEPVVNLMDPYSTYGFHIVVNSGSSLKSLDELNSSNVTFVGMSGTVEESYPKELYPSAKVKGIATNDIAAWIGEVASGQADAAFLDPGTFKILTTQNPALGERLKVLNGEDELVKPVGLAYAVRPENTYASVS